MADLLLHSLAEFGEVIFAALERLRPKSILEIGSETGVFSERLLDHCAKTDAQLIVVEPFPAEALIQVALATDTLHLVAGKSLDYLRQCGCTSEVVLIDGDHNYFTVANELALIDRSWNEHGVSGAIFLHDVGFPCGRRDSYYDPRDIPDEARHPHRFDRGVTTGAEKLIVGGFRGEGAFAWAEPHGGPANGVLTAVEDFVATHVGYVYRSIDAVFGLGVLTKEGSSADRAISEIFAPYDNALVRRLEQNRLELYLRVIALQDELAAIRAASAQPTPTATPAS
jgi:predicted O-methyltransferase YrrM